MPLRDTPIRRKLMTILLTMSGVVVVLTCSAFFAYEFLTFRQNAVRQLSTLGEVIASNSTAALTFDNQNDAAEILHALKAERHIVAAALYDKNGKFFSKYPATLAAGDLPAVLERDGHRFTTSALAMTQPVMLDGKRVGTLYLRSDLAEMYDRFRLYAGIVVLVIAGASVVAYGLARVLQRQISGPILALAETARAVSERHDYSVRASKQGEDEVGLLTDSFNQMLTQVQEQDRLRARLGAIVESSDDAIISKTLEGIITSWNPGATRIFGYTAAEIIGQPMLTLIPVERHDEESAILARLRRGENVSHFETVRLRKDGSRVNISATISVIKDADGQVIGASKIARDVTERKRGEAQLRNSEERYRLMFESNPLPMWVYDLETLRFLAVNDAAVRHYGYAREEFLAMDIKGIRPPSEWPAVLADVELARRAPEAHRAQIWLHHKKDGTPIQVEISSHDLPFNGRRARLVLAHDVTARKQAELENENLHRQLEQRVMDRTAQLEAANRELEAFSYSVSHDLRAPLRHVDGFANMLSEHASSMLDDKGRRYVATISDAAKRMGRLIDDLLGFSRYGRVGLQRSRVPLAELVDEVRSRLMSETAADRQVVWSVGPLPIVSGDHAMLRQVFENLLSNALKYTRLRAEAHVAVGTQPGEPGFVTVFVRDNGAGFDMQYADKLFGVFQRLHSAHEFEGNGVGLANVQRIIQRHGGRTWAEGRVDEGATFYFTLPLTPVIAAPAAQPSAPIL